MSTKDPYSRLVDEVAKQARAEIDTFIDDCEAPIERLFIIALYLAIRHHYEREYLDLVLPLPGRSLDIAAKQESVFYRNTLLVDFQPQFATWRPDFLIHYYDYGWPDRKEGWKKLIIECDGHDFHERTKAQAARDRSRDRRATHDGIPVFRFTGSEIWADPWGCAREVIDFVGQGL